jgi:hypothetical protein
MRWKMVGAVLVGSVMVAAACASTNGDHAHQGSDTGVLDALADALGLDRVEGDAQAAEKPTVDEIACTKVFGKAVFAEKTYPGRSRSDLARGAALRCNGAADADGYACTQAPMDVKDGAVRVVCGSEGTTPLPTITIVMPPALL